MLWLEYEVSPQEALVLGVWCQPVLLLRERFWEPWEAHLAFKGVRSLVVGPLGLCPSLTFRILYLPFLICRDVKCFAALHPLSMKD